MQLQGLPLHPSVEPLDKFWERIGAAWRTVKEACQTSATRQEGEGPVGHSVVVMTHGSVIAGMLCYVLGLDKDALSLWWLDAGGITVVDFPDFSDPDRIVVSHGPRLLCKQ